MYTFGFSVEESTNIRILLQICRFCWHRIRTDENGLCPACRKAYPEDPADFKPLSQEEVAKLKAEKRQKDQLRKQKITENRKHLANVRVVQRNLVFVVGLPMRIADAEVIFLINSFVRLIWFIFYLIVIILAQTARYK